MEEADAGDAGGSGCEAGGGVLQRDAAERVDRDGGCGAAGGAKLVDSLPWRDDLAGDNLFEDRGEEDGVGMVDAGAMDVFQGVAGDGDDWRRAVGRGVEAADLGEGEFVRV